MIDYRMQRRLSYIGGGIQAQMSAWPAGGIDTTGLISWWTLDETSGTRNDSHGTNHLTDNNTVAYAAGKKGNAADFERGNNEYLYIDDNASLSYSGDFTIALWAKAESYNESYRGWVAKETASNNREFRLQWALGYLEWIVFTASGAGFAIAQRALANTDFDWHFIICRYVASTRTAYLSLDNGAEGSATLASAMGDTTARFYLGFYIGGLYYDGLLDEVSFWKRTLTPDEITWLYNSGAGRAYSDL